MSVYNFGLQFLLVTAVTVMFGCGDSSGGEPTADAATSGADANIAQCYEPMRECPAKESPRPYLGGPCEQGLTCKYESAGAETTWTFNCTSGVWEVECDSLLEGGCGDVPLAEYCAQPFGGSRTGATVQLGPISATEAFRPFADDELVSVVWGGQGLPMLAYRVQLSGADGIECADVQTTLTAAGETFERVSQYVTLRCSESLGVYVILNFDVCSGGTTEVVLEVTVEGLGTTSATVQLDTVCTN